MTTNAKIAALRQAMTEKGIHAYIIPSNDPHQSEYVADHWKSREWISGFTGSAGTVVVTHDHAGLWTDSRYFLQGEMQLADSEMELHKLVNQGRAEYNNWLADHLPEGSKVGCDGKITSVSALENMQKIFKKRNIETITAHDLIANVWADRPSLPDTPIFGHAIEYAGKSRAEKLAMVREKMKEKEVVYHFISTLDDIAWLYNIRGTDVEFNPVAYYYALVGMEKAWLFIHPAKVPAELAQALEGDGIGIIPYDSVATYLTTLPSDAKILTDVATTNVELANVLHKDACVKGDTIPLHLKAIKNTTEIAGIKRAMMKDGVALTRLYRWLEKELESRTVPEAELAERLAVFRAEQDGYKGESFAAIVGYKSNGAIIHYRPEYGSCADITADGILLLDSGGQYVDGTTDITRTTLLGGEATEEQKRNYTLVLKGHISLALAVYPENTRGIQLDLLARQYLWQYHLNYGHGTGHGVGVFLNVHEPPQGFAPSLSQRGTTVFKEGMFSSNEPGYYKEGQYGMRIENLVITTKAAETDSGNFYKFDTVTLFPIDTQLIDRDLMTEEEISWLNDYHKEVYTTLAPHMEQEEKQWLHEKCLPI